MTDNSHSDTPPGPVIADDLPTLSVTNETTGVRFVVRLFRKGIRYGLGFKLIYDSDKSAVDVGWIREDEGRDEIQWNGWHWYLETLEAIPPTCGLPVQGDAPFLTLSPQNVQDVVQWARQENEKPWVPPPPPPAPASQAETRRNRIPLGRVGFRRATIYTRAHMEGQLFGIMRIEVDWVEVTRNHKMIKVEYVRRGYRRTEIFHESSLITLVILLGWNHPDMVQTWKPVEMAGDLLLQTTSADEQEEDFEKNLSRYISSQPLARVLLDLRGARLEDDLTDITASGTSSVALLDREGTEHSVSELPSIFISYYHGHDWPLRKALEDKIGDSFLSVSFYPGEASAESSDRVLRTVLRPRIQACDATIVLVSDRTYTRKWVDWEIHAALSPQNASEVKPLLGILSPEISSELARILKLLPVRGYARPREIIKASNDMSAQLLRDCGFTLPARLLDNLIGGHARLISWPESAQDVQHSISMLASGTKGKIVNSRTIAKIDL